MTTRKFTIGDHVRLTTDIYADNNPRDVYTISRLLPAQANVWQYRMKRVGDGQERAASEAQLVKVTAEDRSGRTQIEEQRELQRVRNIRATERARSATRRPDRNRG
jgi:hypothetical protein